MTQRLALQGCVNRKHQPIEKLISGRTATRSRWIAKSSETCGKRLDSLRHRLKAGVPIKAELSVRYLSSFSISTPRLEKPLNAH
jgi:hypothetical protein